MISQKHLKSILKYDPDTGLFTWLITDVWRLQGTIAGGPSGGYVRIQVDDIRYGAHQLAFIWMTGECPEYIDHRNNDRSDNRWLNLRPATRQQNNQNTKLRRDNKLGIKGVVMTPNGKFCAQITCNGKTKSKTFATIEEASKFVIEQRNKCHGEFANHG